MWLAFLVEALHLWINNIHNLNVLKVYKKYLSDNCDLDVIVAECAAFVLPFTKMPWFVLFFYQKCPAFVLFFKKNVLLSCFLDLFRLWEACLSATT